MKVLKRMASVVVAVIMVLQIAAFAAPVPEDVIGTEYEAAASLLCALDIMVGDGTNFNPDDNITRAEFAQIMMKSMALDSAAESYKPVGLFTDVATNNIFAPAIELGAGIGAIKGYGDGTFGPDDNVLGQEAVKMMTFACGHDVTAEANGGYPAGYMANAMEIGMLKGITSIDFTVPMTRGQAAVLCANTLKVDMKKKVTEGGKIKYVEYKDVNLLSEKHDTYKAEGLVSANDVTSMWQSSGLREGRVQIESGANRGVYLAGATAISDALGQYVKAYYKYDEDAGESTIVSYEAVSNKTEIITTDLSNVDFDTVKNSKVEYWQDKENDTRISYVDISDSPSIMFNGAARTINKTIVDTFAQIDGKHGDVTFIDNDGDGKMDVISVTAYDTIYVNRVNTKDFKVNDKISGNNYDIDVESSSVTVSIVDIDGEELEFEDISVGDVLSIAASDEGADRKYIKVIDSQESAEGEITALATKDGQYVFEIDGDRYELTPEYFDFVTNGKGTAATSAEMKARIGSYGEFYLDAFDKIAYHKLSGASGDATFGILRAAAPGKGADTSLKLRIYSDGEYADYTAASKVNIDGTVYKSEETIAAALNRSIAAIEAQNKYYNDIDGVIPLLFDVDADDKINMIDTPYMGAEESEYSLQPVKGTTLTPIASVKYNKSTTALGSLIRCQSGSYAIQLPALSSQIDNTNKITVTKSSTWANERQFTNVQAFTTEPDSAKMLYSVMKLNATSSSATLGDTAAEYHDKQMFIVSEVVECINDEGDQTIKIVGLQEGAKKEFMVDADYYATDLYNDIWAFGTGGVFNMYANEVEENPIRKTSIFLPGDAIRFRTNDAGEISFATPTYLIDAKVFRADDQGTTQGDTRYRAFDLAVVNEIEDDTMYLRYLINKKTTAGAAVRAKLTINDKGFVVSSKNTAGLELNLYDEDAGVYLPDMEADEMQMLNAFKIMVYDASKPAGQKVYAGSTFDLYDAQDNSVAASLVIMQFRSSSPRGMYIIKY